MKSSYLFPNRFKLIGWIVFIPFTLLGIFYLIYDFHPELLNTRVFALIAEPKLDDQMYFLTKLNNITDELIGLGIITGGFLVAFSKEKVEDEFISKLRLESLAWAVYASYIILAAAIVFVYDTPFFTVMTINMFTVLIFFIIKFNWKLNRAKK